MAKIRCCIKGRIKPGLVLIFVCLFQNISAQLSKTAQSAQFNFWVGKWELFSNGSKFGESTVDTLLDNFVIQEDFVEYPPDPFHGINLTTYNADSNKWEQTMVDNQGHHSFFTGEFKDGAAILIRNFKNKNREARVQRTRYNNISKNSFDWTFDASADGGKTWTVYYTVHYVRKK
jgi:hypothetical protein